MQRRMYLALWSVSFLLAGEVLAAQDGKEKAKTIEGIWLGKLDVGEVSLRVLALLKAQENSFEGTLESLDQGGGPVPLSTAEIKDGVVRLAIKKIGASFEGKIDQKGSQIEGKWKQSGLELPLTFKRLEKAPASGRPQDPKRPYPYLDEEVVFENKKHKLKLAGTLTLPKGEGPFPAVLLISGSGPQDRDERMVGHRPFLVLADYLTRKGIAVLRVDDRGVGNSTGSFWAATSADFAQDVLAGVEFLKGRREIDPAGIGLIGHSEGGLIAPMAAVESKDVAFVVLLAGTGLPGADIIMLQTRALLQSAKVKPKQMEWSLNLQKRLVGIMMAEGEDKEVQTKIEAAVKEELEKLDAEDKAKVEKTKGAMQTKLPREMLLWTRFFVRHDPRPVLRKVKAPVLALCGEKDIQVSAKENLPQIEKALKEGGNPDATVKELANLNHMFQTCKTGAVGEYAAIEETMAPAVLELVAAWIEERTRRKK